MLATCLQSVQYTHRLVLVVKHSSTVRVVCCVTELAASKVCKYSNYKRLCFAFGNVFIVGVAGHADLVKGGELFLGELFVVEVC